MSIEHKVSWTSCKSGNFETLQAMQNPCDLHSWIEAYARIPLVIYWRIDRQCCKKARAL